MRYWTALPIALALAVCGCETYVHETADAPDVVVPDRTPDVDVQVDRTPDIVVPDRGPDIDIDLRRGPEVTLPDRVPDVDVKTPNLEVDVDRTP